MDELVIVALSRKFSMQGSHMKTKKICLKAVMTNREGKSVWSGEYACSVCGLRFHPDPNDPARLTQDFEIHRDEHHVNSGQN
ncbi:MAG TPA: hypothetical protein VK709_19890 [Candidatus Saccharimonadales bacterium]|nr:hypothetical protein [Candidatus Saccharimonadales bacterium]